LLLPIPKLLGSSFLFVKSHLLKCQLLALGGGSAIPCWLEAGCLKLASKNPTDLQNHEG